MHAKSQDSRRLIARIAGDRKMGPAAGAFSLLMDRCRARPELGMAPLPRLLLRDLGRGTRLLIFLLLPRCWSGGDRTTLSPARRKIRLVVTAQQQQKIRAARGAWAARGGPAGCADQASAHPQLVKSNQSDVGALVSIRPSSHVAQSSQAPQGCCAVLLGGCRSCCPRRVLQPPFFSSFFFFPLLFPAPQPDTTLPAGVRCVLDSTTTCEPCIAVVERAIHKVGGDRFFFSFFFLLHIGPSGFTSARPIQSLRPSPGLPLFPFPFSLLRGFWWLARERIVLEKRTVSRAPGSFLYATLPPTDRRFASSFVSAIVPFSRLVWFSSWTLRLGSNEPFGTSPAFWPVPTRHLHPLPSLPVLGHADPALLILLLCHHPTPGDKTAPFSLANPVIHRH